MEQESAKVTELISLTKYTVSQQDNSFVCKEITFVTPQQGFDLRSEFAGEIRLSCLLLVTDDFQLKIHLAEVQSCVVRDS
jgi:hypothetical protein